MDYLLVNQAMFNKYNHIDSNGAYVINKSITRPNWLIDVFLVVIDNHIIHKNYKPRTAKDWSSKLEEIII